MNITIVGPTYPYKGGIAQHTTELAHRLTDEGHHVEILSWSAQYPRFLYPGELELADGADEGRFPRVKRSLAWNQPWTWWTAGSGPAHSAQLLILTLASPVQVPVYLVLAARMQRAGVKVVVICHNVEPHDGGGLQRALAGWLLRRVDGVLVHSPEEASKARALGARRVATSALPFHFPASIEPAPVHADLVEKVLFFGFVRPYKGLEQLLDAMLLTTTPVSLIVAGEFWVPAAEVRQLVESRGLGDRVELREGYLPAEQISDVLAEVDAVILPYRSGTGSQQPRIAHAARKPVVATDVGDLSSRVVDGVGGFVCPPDDPAALARAIDRLYEPGVSSMLRERIDVHAADEWSEYNRLLVEAGTGDPLR